MSRVMALLLFLASSAAPSAAQTTDGGFDPSWSTSLASMTKSMHATIRRDLLEAAEKMPAEFYSFKPTAEIRSFAQLVGHVINANYYFCGQAKGDPPQTTQNFEQVNEKAALVKALSEALTYCDAVYAAATDATFTQPVKLAGRGAAAETARGSVLVFNTTHNNEHYGNIIIYLRLKGQVPPSTARAQSGR